MTSLTSPHPSPVRCLIVEDDPAMRALLLIQLELVGADVTTVADAPAALDRIESTDPPFQVVMSDHRLPDERRGIEVLEAAMTAWPATERFLLSAHLDDLTVAQARSIGAVVVDKIDMSPIVDRVTQLMTG